MTTEHFLLLALGLAVIAVVVLQFDTFRWLGTPFTLSPNHLGFLMTLGLAFTALGYRTLPAQGTSFNLSRWVAYPLLALIFGVAAFLRLHRIDEPFGFYWDDPAIAIIDPRTIVDYHEFRLMYPIGHREAMYPFAAAGVWWLFPWLKPLIAERLTSALFDLVAIWVFYLLGREVSGKRLVGVLLAAFAAASKPMIMQGICGMPGLILPLDAGLLLLFQARVFKKPNLAHFLEWGTALGFVLYSYITIRPWIAFLAVITVGWILWTRRKEPLGWLTGVGVGLFGLAFVFTYADRMLTLFLDNPISRLWMGNGAVWFVLQVAFLIFLVHGYRTTKGKERILHCWALGLLWAGLLMYPMESNPEFSLKIKDISILPKGLSAWFSPQFWHTVHDQTKEALTSVFVGGLDRPDMNVVGDPFFDYHAVVLVAFGLACALVRPSWWKAFLFVCAWVGIVGRVMTADPQSAKILSAAPPLLLLSAMAMNHWIENAWKGPWKTRWMGILLVVGLGCFWAWEIRGTYLRVYEKWWYVMTDDVRTSQEVKKDLEAGRVIYMAPYHGFGFFSPAVQSVLHDGKVLYILNPTNVIHVLPGEEPKEVSVIVSGRDKPFDDQLSKEFPKAQWIPAWQYFQDKAERPYLYHMIIPVSQIPSHPGKRFMYEKVPAGYWLRRSLTTYYGLGKGMVEWEDASPTLNPPPSAMGAHSDTAERTWEVPEDGDYEFVVRTPDIIRILIDDKVVFDAKAFGTTTTFKNTVFLKKGSHRFVYMAYLKVVLRFPPVTVRNPKAHFEQTLE